MSKALTIILSIAGFFVLVALIIQASSKKQPAKMADIPLHERKALKAKHFEEFKEMYSIGKPETDEPETVEENESND